jgi:endoglycosylceramidase
MALETSGSGFRAFRALAARRAAHVAFILTAAAALSSGACGSSSGPASASPSGPAPPPPFRACTIAPPATTDWRLSTSGTSFRDWSGRQVFLRGVAAGGRSKFTPYVPFDFAAGQYAKALAAYMDRAASWGINVLRVPFTWAALEPTMGQDDAAWLSLFDQLLDAAWARGMYTILDFHQDVYSEVYCGDGFPGWTVSNPPAPHHDCPMWSNEYSTDADVRSAFDSFWAAGSPVQAEYLAAWDVMIARYKDKPGVLGFEPINEPGWGTAVPDTFSATTLTSFYAMIVSHMRSAAPQSLVFIDTNGEDGLALATRVERPPGDGVVFAPHFYPVNHDPSAVSGELKAWADTGASWKVPVFVGEFGLNDTSSTALPFIRAIFAGFDAQGLNGSEWEYSVSTDVWNSERFGLVAADGSENPVAKAIQRPFARAVAGTSVKQAWNAASSTFTLSYQASGGAGVTEVSLPSGAYPSGYDLTLAGACADTTSSPGRLLLREDVDGGTSSVSLRIAPK